VRFSLDSAAKVGEITGAIAVIVGLLFVGLEIRVNTLAKEGSATQTLVSEYNKAVSAINDPEFVCIYIRAGSDFSGLSQANKIRYSILMQPIFRVFEQLHYSALQGTIDSNVYSGFQQQFVAIMQLPGNRQYWAVRGSWFGSVFQDYVEDVISNTTGVTPANFSSEECE
jgi:hypothetical protein